MAGAARRRRRAARLGRRGPGSGANRAPTRPRFRPEYGCLPTITSATRWPAAILLSRFLRAAKSNIASRRPQPSSRAFSPAEDFQTIRRLIGLILGEPPDSPVVAEIAEWIDLRVFEAPGVREVARSLAPEYRTVATHYDGADGTQGTRTSRPTNPLPRGTRLAGRRVESPLSERASSISTRRTRWRF